MRSVLSVACLFVMLAAATPAQAQLRGGDDARRSPVRIFGSNEAMVALNKLFSPAHFRMSHSYEFSTSSFGGGSSLGMYTNTMMWQFNQKLAARVDVSYAHTPFGGNQFGMESGGRVFLRNAEIAYRPTERMELHFSIRQSPFGSYMGPYGYYSPFYGYGHGFGYGFDRSDDLFWNTPQR
ncbi:MAG TPA: hypothetical protein VF190_15525 [Rhodothermales bacterium]